MVTKTCDHCGKAAALSPCDQCFPEYFSRKAHAALRGHLQGELLIDDSPDAAGVALASIMGDLATQRRLTMRIVKTGADFGSACLDDYAAALLDRTLGGKSSGETAEKLINPLRKLTYAECSRYCSLKGLAHQERASTPRLALLHRLEGAAPGAAHGLARAAEALDEMAAHHRPDRAAAARGGHSRPKRG